MRVIREPLHISSLHKQPEELLHCHDLSGFLVCDRCHGPHGLMDTAVLPQAKGRKEGQWEKIQTGKRRKRDCVCVCVCRSLCVCVFGGVVDCPLALSGACAHSAWHPAYSAPHTDPTKKTLHNGQQSNTQSKVTQTCFDTEGNSTSHVDNHCTT